MYIVLNIYSIQDGILFYFSHMKEVSYNSSKDTITLQPGIHWGEALNTLEALGVAPMGGRLRYDQVINFTFCSHSNIELVVT